MRYCSGVRLARHSSSERLILSFVIATAYAGVSVACTPRAGSTMSNGHLHDGRIAIRADRPWLRTQPMRRIEWHAVRMPSKRIVLAPGASGTIESLRGHERGLTARGLEVRLVELPKGRVERALPVYRSALEDAGDPAPAVGGHS